MAAAWGRGENRRRVHVRVRACMCVLRELMCVIYVRTEYNE